MHNLPLACWTTVVLNCTNNWQMQQPHEHDASAVCRDALAVPQYVVADLSTMATSGSPSKSGHGTSRYAPQLGVSSTLGVLVTAPIG